MARPQRQPMGRLHSAAPEHGDVAWRHMTLAGVNRALSPRLGYAAPTADDDGDRPALVLPTPLAAPSNALGTWGEPDQSSRSSSAAGSPDQRGPANRGPVHRSAQSQKGKPKAASGRSRRAAGSKVVRRITVGLLKSLRARRKPTAKAGRLTVGENSPRLEKSGPIPAAPARTQSPQSPPNKAAPGPEPVLRRVPRSSDASQPAPPVWPRPQGETPVESLPETDSAPNPSTPKPGQRPGVLSRLIPALNQVRRLPLRKKPTAPPAAHGATGDGSQSPPASPKERPTPGTTRRSSGGIGRTAIPQRAVTVAPPESEPDVSPAASVEQPGSHPVTAIRRTGATGGQDDLPAAPLPVRRLERPKEPLASSAQSQEPASRAIQPVRESGRHDPGFGAPAEPGRSELPVENSNTPPVHGANISSSMEVPQQRLPDSKAPGPVDAEPGRTRKLSQPMPALPTSREHLEGPKPAGLVLLARITRRSEGPVSNVGGLTLANGGQDQLAGDGTSDSTGEAVMTDSSAPARIPGAVIQRVDAPRPRAVHAEGSKAVLVQRMAQTKSSSTLETGPTRVSARNGKSSSRGAYKIAGGGDSKSRRTEPSLFALLDEPQPVGEPEHLPLAPAIHRARESGRTSLHDSPTAGSHPTPADGGGGRRQAAQRTSSNNPGPPVINPSAFAGLKTRGTVAEAATPPLKVNRAVRPNSAIAAAPESEELEQSREFQGWEIEFLASRVYAYLKDKLVMERERHGRPGFTSWP